MGNALERLRRGDRVRLPGFDDIGVVKRVAKDGRWADVRWRQWSANLGVLYWTKRQPDASLLQRLDDADDPA